MAERDTPTSPIPESRKLAKKKTRLSLVWIIPIVAALIGVWVASVKIMNQGPTITIELHTAEGLEAGKTEVHYNGVTIGTVKSIRLTDDHTHVIATVNMAPKTESLLVEDTKFWVVSPRISGATVTGLNTLISGAYIGMEIGKSSKPQRNFVALSAPPVVTGEVPGTFYILKSTDLGSVDYGTPIYFRRLQVGQVASYQLDKDGQFLTIKIFINAPYDQLVTSETRFWQASGLDVSLSASGVHVQTQSVLSMLIGGLAFETPDSAQGLPPAAANTQFTLYEDRLQAFRPPPVNPQTYILAFNQSVRGLEPGAPVELRGIPVGTVTDIRAQIDAETARFNILVTISVDPQRLGVKVHGRNYKESYASQQHRLVDALVAHGLRAQLQTGNLLTGAKYVALDFFPNAPHFKVDWSQKTVQFATVPGSLEGLDTQLTGIITKLNKVNYQQIGGDLQKTLATLNQTLASAKSALDHADTMLKSNAGVDQQLINTLQEIDRAAQSLRVLSDYLERHPEALIRGKSEENKP